MRSTMMGFPLTVRHIFEHGRALYADSEVITSEAGGARHTEFMTLANRAGQLAALRRLGVEPGDWLRTGDVGRIDSHGFITISERAKDVVKPGGEWISTLELEAAILTRPAVREVAVIAAPDPRWGERPLACVVLAPSRSVTPEELREQLSGLVVKWWLPERWAFVGALPRTSVGKYDKKLLRARNAEGGLDVEVSDEPPTADR